MKLSELKDTKLAAKTSVQKERSAKWKNDRLQGCTCPTEKRSDVKCPVHGADADQEELDEARSSVLDDVILDLQELHKLKKNKHTADAIEYAKANAEAITHMRENDGMKISEIADMCLNIVKSAEPEPAKSVNS